jgi:putative sigma-54 modulation protein
MTKLNVQSRNCEVSEELQAHFEGKLAGLERLWPKSDEALVRLSCERGRFSAEVTLLTGGMMTRGEERAATLRQAFDCAMDKLESQLRRYKDKKEARTRRHDNRDDVAGTVSNVTLPSAGLAPDGISPNAGGFAANDTAGGADAAQAGAESESDEQVVRVKRFALKPMSAEEASLQMGLLGHSFFVFRDAGSNQVSVVYRRRDGGYGLIEPVAD